MTEHNKLAREVIVDVCADSWCETASPQQITDAILESLADCGYVIVDHNLLGDVVGG